ncbi:hypothetical protein CQW23_35554 [Capsicum baccatum]|uniref:Uncharacterized protein n=1 Tax=Capsicum baccatum TaxID=33114 RepID=A0A2G2UVK1_CAPBA|nr:hypothetical protein CQW23_35554 [Capsicum baccatum]
MELTPCQCLQISCPNQEELSIYDANNITALCSHQLPTAYFNKLKELDVWSCEKLRNLMSPSVARGSTEAGHFILTKRPHEFPFLKEVYIRECPKMKTFIQQGIVSTLNLESVNNDDELKVVDLNKAMFNSKACPVPLYN